MSEVKTCDSCKSPMVPNPEPYARAGNLLCFECDFKPEVIKREFEQVFKTMESALPSFPSFERRKKTPFLTESPSEMNNYLRDVLSLVDEDQSAIRDDFLGPSANFSMLLSMARHRYVYKYAWAIPCKLALQTIAKYSPIVEIGAGSGYWAHLLTQLGADVVAYDTEKQNRYSKTGLRFHQRWFDGP